MTRTVARVATLTVLGVPRLDLALVSWASAGGGDAARGVGLAAAYEMIIAGVYEP